MVYWTAAVADADAKNADTAADAAADAPDADTAADAADADADADEADRGTDPQSCCSRSSSNRPQSHIGVVWCD